MLDIRNINNKRVLLRVDLDSALRFRLKFEHIIPTIQLLLRNGCGVCVFVSLGPALLQPSYSSRSLIAVLSEYVNIPVTWLPSLLNAQIKLGGLYLSENTFMDKRDIQCDQAYVHEIIQSVDVVVYDSLRHLDANYASAQGVLRAPIEQAFGLRACELIRLHTEIRRSKIGFIAGGGRVAWQLKLIRAMIKNLSFLAVGGEMALVMMGKGPTMSGLLHDEILKTLAILRKEKVKVLYPVDVVAYSLESQRNRICLYQDLDAEEMVYDLGTQSRNRILSHIDQLPIDMVVVSGIIGLYLDPRYSRGSEILIQELVKREHNKVLIGREAILTASRLSVLRGYQHVLEGDTLEMSFLSENKSLTSLLQQGNAITSQCNTS